MSRSDSNPDAERVTEVVSWANLFDLPEDPPPSHWVEFSTGDFQTSQVLNPGSEDRTEVDRRIYKIVVGRMEDPSPTSEHRALEELVDVCQDFLVTAAPTAHPRALDALLDIDLERPVRIKQRRQPPSLVLVALLLASVAALLLLPSEEVVAVIAEADRLLWVAVHF